MNTKYFIILALALLFALAGSAQQYKYPFQNPNLPVEQRVNKVSQCAGLSAATSMRWLLMVFVAESRFPVTFTC